MNVEVICMSMAQMIVPDSEWRGLTFLLCFSGEPINGAAGCLFLPMLKRYASFEEIKQYLARKGDISESDKEVILDILSRMLPEVGETELQTISRLKACDDARVLAIIRAYERIGE